MVSTKINIGWIHFRYFHPALCVCVCMCVSICVCDGVRVIPQIFATNWIVSLHRVMWIVKDKNRTECDIITDPNNVYVGIKRTSTNTVRKPSMLRALCTVNPTNNNNNKKQDSVIAVVVAAAAVAANGKMG